jgi:hypothetical protein
MNEFQRIRAERIANPDTTKRWPRKFFRFPKFKADPELIGKQVFVKFKKNVFLIGTITGFNLGSRNSSFAFSWNRSDNPHLDNEHWNPYPELAPSNYMATILHCSQVICAI